MTARRIRRSLAASAALLLAGTAAARAATVTLLVEGAGSDGTVLASLCAGGLEPADCPRGDAQPARGGTLRFVFRDVPPGLYAAAAFQDVNGDGRLDRAPVGLPLEPYGFSNGVGRTAPPRFERAAFPVEGDVVVRVRIEPPPGRR